MVYKRPLCFLGILRKDWNAEDLVLYSFESPFLEGRRNGAAEIGVRRRLAGWQLGTVWGSGNRQSDRKASGKANGN